MYGHHHPEVKHHHMSSCLMHAEISSSLSITSLTIIEPILCKCNLWCKFIMQKCTSFLYCTKLIFMLNRTLWHGKIFYVIQKDYLYLMSLISDQCFLSHGKIDPCTDTERDCPYLVSLLMSGQWMLSCNVIMVLYCVWVVSHVTLPWCMVY